MVKRKSHFFVWNYLLSIFKSKTCVNIFNPTKKIHRTPTERNVSDGGVHSRGEDSIPGRNNGTHKPIDICHIGKNNWKCFNFIYMELLDGD